MKEKQKLGRNIDIYLNGDKSSKISGKKREQLDFSDYGTE